MPMAMLHNKTDGYSTIFKILGNAYVDEKINDQYSGGLPTAVMSGRNVIQLICRDHAKRFVAYKPRRIS